MIWRICAIVTEQSHVLNCRMFCILISLVILSICDLLLFLFSDCRSLYAVCGILFRLGKAHFSVSGDSIASLFIFLGIGFEPCNNHYLAAFVLPGPAICFCGKMLCFLSRLFVS